MDGIYWVKCAECYEAVRYYENVGTIRVYPCENKKCVLNKKEEK